MNTAMEIEDFPETAKSYLDAFYKGHRIKGNDTSTKIAALRSAHNLKDAILIATGGIEREDMELRTLEFIVLTRMGLLE